MNIRKSFLSLFIFLILTSCLWQNTVEEHFKNHGMSYPLEVSGVTLWNVKYAGIKEEELSAPGAREYIESGIMFIKEYFKRRDFKILVPGAEAIALDKPVLFRDEAGDVGLMVKLTAYGTVKPDGKTGLTVEWIGAGKRLWKAENFAYFRQNDIYKWEYYGLVY